MKNIFKKALILFLLISSVSLAQVQKHVKWKFTSENEKGQNVLVLTATIDKGWHMYSQTIEEGAGLPTSFEFQPKDNYSLVGKTAEIGKLQEVFDEILKLKLRYFENKVVFKQKIKANTDKDFVVNGILTYMVCNDRTCNPPEDVEFNFKVKPVSATSAEKTTSTLGNTGNVPQSQDLIQDIKKDSASRPGTVTKKEDSMKAANAETMAKIENYKDKPSMSLWTIFIEGFLGGFAALLMPCIFPMIPLTVSYFTKKEHSKVKAISHAGVYGISIILIYVALGFGVTKLLGADALNDLASNGIFNSVFFVLLVVFAASFLGAFEITLPSSWVNRADQNSEKGGVLGLFFMAFTLALVSFSCTGPIIGTLLVEAASGKHALGPIIGMGGFSLALALPFAFFAAFPSVVKSLPRSGGWLNSVKVVLGFLELALALKFLSAVDLAYHLHILDREVFLVLWIVIFSMIGFYLLGKIKFSHDSDLAYVTLPRLFMALFSFAFSLYMIPGLWGAPLKAISGFAPPLGTQDFNIASMTMAPSTNHSSFIGMKKYSDLFHSPNGLDCFFDYDEAMTYAKKVNKPLFVDFTGHSCVNCRKMEASVWSNPEVAKRLNEDFVLVSLYVDDKTDLPKSEQFISKTTGKNIKTIGNKWSDFQISQFQRNAQPTYVILNHEGDMVTEPHEFDLNIENYIMFLDKGKMEFNKKK